VALALLEGALDLRREVKRVAAVDETADEKAAVAQDPGT